MSAFTKWFFQGLSSGGGWLVSILFFCVGLHLLKKAKKTRSAHNGKPQEPVWWKAPERWVEDPELLGLFLTVLGAGAILHLLWQLASVIFAGK